MSDDKRSKVEDDPDAPPSEEEVAESKKLRDALEEGTDPIAAALQAAWAPAPMDARTHAQIIDELPTAEELKLAALIDEDEMVLALKAAWNPAPIDAQAHRTIVDRATARAVVLNMGGVRPSVRRVNIAIVTTTTAFALAASIIVWVTAGPSGGLKSEVALAKARSTQPLFDEPFKAGETSARIDRIALARSSDYRDNLFARRGVR